MNSLYSHRINMRLLLLLILLIFMGFIRLSGVSAQSSTVSAIVRIETGGNIKTSSTYGPSFYVQNTSTSGQEIVSVSWNISTALVPDVAFDPIGLAGDTVGRCLFPSTGAAATGYIQPANLCTTPFSDPYQLGYRIISTNFNDFDPGESFLFGVDIDPISTRGTNQPGPDDSASVSGYELIGSVVTITFSDGSVLTTQLWRFNNSVTGSYNVAQVNSLVAPSIQLLGGATNTTVTTANQIIRVTGPAGSQISLLLSEGDMVEQNGGGYDVDPYELNTILNVVEYTATIGAGGTVDIPITLLDDALIDGTYGGMNYIIAVIRSGNITSNLSNRIALTYEPNGIPPSPTPPPTGGQVTSLQLINAGTNQSIMTLTNGAIIYPSNYPQGISIQAVTSGTISQIQFSVNGSQGQTEGVAPYAIAGDNNGNYTAWNVPLGNYTVVATPLNNTSGTLSVSFTLAAPTVNAPPNVTNPGSRSNVTGTVISLQVVANDPEGLALSYSASGLPTGLSINTSTGLISGTIAAGAASSSPFASSVSVSDGTNPLVTVNFTWTVTTPPVGSQVTSLQLINTGTDLPVMTLTNGTIVYPSTYPQGISIQALTSGTISQVQFSVNGTLGQTEGVAPYAIAGDTNGNYSAWNVPLGNYTITATPLNNPSGALTVNITLAAQTVNLPPNVTNPGSRSNVTGTVISLQVVANDPEGLALSYSASGLPTGLSINASTGLISGTIAAGATSGSPFASSVSVSDGTNPPVTVNFTWTVTAPPVGSQVTSMQLINAGTDTAISTLSNGDVISLATYPQGISIQALTSGTISQIQFTVNGNAGQTEGVAPYAIAGDTNGNYSAWNVGAGSYTITATPLNNPSGALTITITLTN